MITRDETVRKVKAHVMNPRLIKHMIAVSAIMSGLAEYLGDDKALWEAVGMLHDIDYERVEDDFNRHGIVSAELLIDVLPEVGLHAIKAHNLRTGVSAENKMDVALIAADALSGLVIATALMMPKKRLETVKVRSLRRKFKDGSFARGVDRNNIKQCEGLGLSLEEFFTLGLRSMQKISDELGL